MFSSSFYALLTLSLLQLLDECTKVVAASTPPTTHLNHYCPPLCTCKWTNGKQSVECSRRELITIPEGIDADTQILSLAENNLQILPSEVFANAKLVSLQRIFLQQCHIGQIDDAAFRRIRNLVELDLSGNLLTNVPTAALFHTPLMRFLTLASNPIQRIEANAFRNLTGLQRLDLSNCEIHTISLNAFDGIDSLETLKLNGNRLVELQSHVVHQLQRLQVFAIDENPWQCDCRLRSLKEWLMNADYLVQSEIVAKCSGGSERVIGKMFAELSLDDFACKPHFLPVSHYLEASSGTNASLTCRANAFPPPLLKWYWSGRLLENSTKLTNKAEIDGGIGDGGGKSVFIVEHGGEEKRSVLVIVDAEPINSGEYYCTAENRAGSVEVNFTLSVLHERYRRVGGGGSVGGASSGVSAGSMGGVVGGVLISGQVALFGATLLVLIIFVLFVVSVVMMRRVRSLKFQKQVMYDEEDNNCNSSTTKLTSSMIIANVKHHQQQQQQQQQQQEQQLPQLQQNQGIVINNPDLINDTALLEHVEKTASGEYIRNFDSLYPSGLWDLDNTSNSDNNDRKSTNDGAFYPADYGLPMVLQNDANNIVVECMKNELRTPEIDLKSVLKRSNTECLDTSTSTEV